MITAIVLSIVIHAQMTVPWIGGTAAPTAVTAKSTPIVLAIGKPLVLISKNPIIIH